MPNSSASASQELYTWVTDTGIRFPFITVSLCRNTMLPFTRLTEADPALPAETVS